MKGVYFSTEDISAPVDLEILEIRENCLAPDGSLPLLVTALGANGATLATTWLRLGAWADPMNVTMSP